MRHFGFLTDTLRQELFSVPPRDVDRRGDREVLAQALGAVLYTPGTRTGVEHLILDGRVRGLSSMVLCLEDAIGDAIVEEAEREVLRTLDALGNRVTDMDGGEADLPLLFVRVRSPHHLATLGPRLLEHLGVLTGVVLPKFSTHTAPAYLTTLDDLARRAGPERRIYAMPILETPDLIYREQRGSALERLVLMMDEAAPHIMCVRLGGTDFSGLFGLRRSVEMTIWDIQVIRECMGDILNHLGRRERLMPVSAPVWEYFHTDQRVLKPQLRSTPFVEAGVPTVRQRLLNRAFDGLIREVLMDQANGLTGKTVIHPSHVLPVHALMAVTHEEHEDARAILDADIDTLGAMPSASGNKMNEVKPHRLWAERVLLRAHCFGVLAPSASWVSVLEAAERVPAPA